MWNKIRASRALWTALFVLVALIWGVAFVVVKDSMEHISPMYMLAARFTVAFIAGALLCVILKCSLNREVLIKGIYLGVSLFIAYVLQTYGIKYTTAGKNAFITAFYIVLVPFLNFLFFRRKVTVLQTVGALMAIVGVGLLTLGGDKGINRGDLLTLACAVAFAIQIVLMARFSPKVDCNVLNAVQLGCVTLLSVILAPVLDGPFADAVQFSPGLVGAMLYLGLLSTFFAECVQTIGLKYLNPLLATILMSLESVFGVLASVILLGEKLTLKMIFGCCIMFAAILIVESQETDANTQEGKTDTPSR